MLGSPELKHWLDALVGFRDGQVIIVPGGGIFADAVRQAQKLSDISDATAHQLALKAMDQFGLLLAGMNDLLATVSSELEIAERGWQHRCMVWIPSQMVLADDGIPRNWEVTSDSLSAWLANKLEAKQLILVKSKSLDDYSKSTSAQTLVDDGLIDTKLLGVIKGQGYQTWVLNKDDSHLFKKSFSQQHFEQTGLAIY